MPGHGNRHIDPSFESLIKNSGILVPDSCWFDILYKDIEGYEKVEGKLFNLGPLYHKVFNSRLALFSQNGTTGSNLVFTMCLAKKKVAM